MSSSSNYRNFTPEDYTHEDIKAKQFFISLQNGLFIKGQINKVHIEITRTILYDVDDDGFDVDEDFYNNSEFLLVEDTDPINFFEIRFNLKDKDGRPLITSEDIKHIIQSIRLDTELCKAYIGSRYVYKDSYMDHHGRKLTIEEEVAAIMSNILKNGSDSLEIKCKTSVWDRDTLIDTED
jgi:hypothetical protein